MCPSFILKQQLYYLDIEIQQVYIEIQNKLLSYFCFNYHKFDKLKIKNIVSEKPQLIWTIYNLHCNWNLLQEKNVQNLTKSGWLASPKHYSWNTFNLMVKGFQHVWVDIL